MSPGSLHPPARPSAPADAGARAGCRWQARAAGLAFVASLAVGAALVGTQRGPDPHGPALQVKPGIFAIHAGNVWIYAARSGDGAVLFDAGGDASAGAVQALLDAMRLAPGRVRDVFITHAHRDHFGGISLFPGARLHAGAGDLALLSAPAPRSRGGGARPQGGSAPGDRAEVLRGATAVPIGAGEVLAFPVPGHTQGSYAFLYGGTLFAGDALRWSGETFRERADLVDVDYDEGRRSVLALASAAAPAGYDTVCTGHGGCTPVGEGRRLLEAFAR